MRPVLDGKTDPEQFRNFYWLKAELSEFCGTHGLSGSGSKDEIAERIYEFLKTGEKLQPDKKNRIAENNQNPELSLNSIIRPGYRNDEKHRIFFKSVIGGHFKFNVRFMDWMKQNAGKTYSDAVDEWIRIAEGKKLGVKTEISSQFQYNQYTRDFYEANPGAKMDDVLKCWKYKKSLPGHNRYEDSDLDALKK